jgi:hypothetical protein
MLDLASRLLAECRPEGECLISPRTPSKARPMITVPGLGQVMASRVIVAADLGREVTASEDAHHRCRTPRCLRPAHLHALASPVHQEEHAQSQRQQMCSTHQVPYDRIDARGWGYCQRCRTDASIRYRQRHPDRLAAYRSSEAGKRSQKQAQARYRATPEYRAKAAARQRARRSRLTSST